LSSDVSLPGQDRLTLAGRMGLLQALRTPVTVAV